MNHLVIEQNNGITEEVSNDIISKLYDIAKSGLDSSSSVVGRVHTTKAYRHQVEALTGQTGYFPELYITKDNYIAYFEDPEVKRIMQNTYGELLENQLGNITNIGNMFSGTNIETFMELAQTGVTGLAWDAFKGCTDLEHVDVSKITDLEHVGGMDRTHTFMDCSKLEELDFSSLQFGYLRFSDNGSIVTNCPLLKSVNMPEYLGSDRWQYENNYSAKDYAFQVQSPFYNCTSLEYVNLGKCDDLKFISPDKYHAGAFYNLPSLKIVECGYHLTSMGTYSFNNTPNMKAVVIRNSTTVPSILNWYNRTPSVANLFGGSSNCIIYVPQAMISVYQADPDWGALSANIQPIENYDKDAILAAS